MNFTRVGDKVGFTVEKNVGLNVGETVGLNVGSCANEEKYDRVGG